MTAKRSLLTRLLRAILPKQTIEQLAEGSQLFSTFEVSLRQSGTTIRQLQSEVDRLAREGVQLKRNEASAGFLASELQSQVMVQRAMLKDYGKVTEALVNADVTTRNRPGKAVPAGTGSTEPAGPYIADGACGVEGCTRGAKISRRGRSGTDRKAGKGRGAAR